MTKKLPKNRYCIVAFFIIVDKADKKSAEEKREQTRKEQMVMPVSFVFIT